MINQLLANYIDDKLVEFILLSLILTFWYNSRPFSPAYIHIIKLSFCREDLENKLTRLWCLWPYFILSLVEWNQRVSVFSWEKWEHWHALEVLSLFFCHGRAPEPSKQPGYMFCTSSTILKKPVDACYLIVDRHFIVIIQQAHTHGSPAATGWYSSSGTSASMAWERPLAIHYRWCRTRPCR